MEQFKVSVIIPVYNAEKYVRTAVESAISLDEVGEVLLVEDCSPDNALEVCDQLEIEYEKVKLIRHPNGENRGAGASRNLGISKARFDFIAFLDADDWYLPNRFKVEAKVLPNNKYIDGVFGATGFFYEDKNLYSDELTTIESKYIKNRLLYNLATNKGSFTTNAITIRKSLLELTGLFDPELKLHQDTHLWYRVAHFGTIISGIIESPIAYRRVHSSNRISQKNRESSRLFAIKVYSSFRNYSNVEAKPFLNIITEYVRAKRSSSVMKYLETLVLTLYHIRQFNFKSKKENIYFEKNLSSNYVRQN